MIGFVADIRPPARNGDVKDQHKRKPAQDRRHACFSDTREECMTKVTRRNVLKTGTALAGGMAGILATGRPPAFAQGATVHWLRWNDFVPASDTLLRREMLPEAEKALGFKINFETVNANDLQPRITSAIQSGAGPDLIMLNNNHPQLYAASLRGHDGRGGAARQDRGRALRAGQGELERRQEVAIDAVGLIGGMIAYRKSWFEEAGATIPGHLGEVPRGRQEAQSQGPPDRPDARSHFRRCSDVLLPLSVVLGRQGSRRKRQGGHQQQGDGRLGQVHDRFLEGRA